MSLSVWRSLVLAMMGLNRKKKMFIGFIYNFFCIMQNHVQAKIKNNTWYMKYLITFFLDI